MDRRGHWVMHGPGGDKETVEVVGRLRSDSGAAVREAVRAGVGVGLMPGFLVEEEFGAGRLVELLPGYEGLAYGVYALYVPSLYPMPVLRAFLDFVVEELAGAAL